MLADATRNELKAALNRVIDLIRLNRINLLAAVDDHAISYHKRELELLEKKRIELEARITNH